MLARVPIGRKSAATQQPEPRISTIESGVFLFGMMKDMKDQKPKQQTAIGFLLLSVAFYVWVFPVVILHLELPFLSMPTVMASSLIAGIFLALYIFLTLKLPMYLKGLVAVIFASAVSFVMFYTMMFSGFAFN